MSQSTLTASGMPAATAWTRALSNLKRFPGRTARSVSQLFSADYRLQRKADATVRRWLKPARRHELESIAGMSSARECRLLAYLAGIAPTGGDIVEIGAWMGKSTAWLVEGAQQNPARPRIISIDPHMRNTWDTFRGTVEQFQLEQRGLKVHRAMSHDIGCSWSGPISLLWVDGCHEYPEVRQDIEDFAPHVVHGGWIVFDDAAGGVFPGVEQAIAERMSVRPAFKHIATLRHLVIFQRNT